MFKYVVVNQNNNVHNTNTLRLHTAGSINAQYELHHRLFVCWWYGLLFMWHCIKGNYVRLIFNAKFMTTCKKNVKGTDISNIHSYKSTRVETLWSELVPYFVLRCLFSPFYGLYIIIHTLLGSDVRYIYSTQDVFLDFDQYVCIDENTILIKDISKSDNS